MTQPNKDQQQKSGPAHPSPVDEAQQHAVDKQQHKAAEHEVAGRHNNDGQNDHAGHKTSR